MTARRFRVALSYPGELREFIGTVADELATALGRERVLYDGFLVAEMARPDLDVYLGALYRNESDLLVPFYSADYERKKWCRLEWRQMRYILLNFDGERVMPFRFDDTPVPGVLSVDGYVSIGDRSPRQVAALILERLGMSTTISAEPRGAAVPRAASPAKATSKATILLPDDYATFSEEKQRLLQRLLAAACEVDEDQIEILRTRPVGSMEVDLLIPEAAARKLLEEFATGQGPLADRGIARVQVEERTTAVSLRHLPTAPWALVGREAELAELDGMARDGKTRIVTIVAFGGTGKTSLVAAWVSRLAAAGWQNFTHVFAWSFYSQGSRPGSAVSSDLFVKTALDFFGDASLADSGASAWQKGERLAQMVSRPGSLLILDGVEPLQDAKTGELRDEGVRALLRGIAAADRGFCIVTSRMHLADLELWPAATRKMPLSNLPIPAAAGLLEHVGVRGTAEEREALAREVRGHALTISLLGRYLAEAYDGDIRKRGLLSLSSVDDGLTAGHAFRVMEAYEEWLVRDGREIELAVLRSLALFDRPAPPDCLRVLREASIVGLMPAAESAPEVEWNRAVTRLVELGLIEQHPWVSYPVTGYDFEQATLALAGDPLGEPHQVVVGGVAAEGGMVLDAHPLLREFFAARLRRQVPHAWQTAHAHLFDHLRNRVPYWPEGLEGLQSLYQAIFHGTQAGRWHEALEEVFIRRIQRGTIGPHAFYSRRRIGAIGADLAAIACFFKEPWTRPAPQLSEIAQTWLLNQAAFSLRAHGRMGEAVEPMREAVERYAREENPRAASTVAGNVSELELFLGRIEEARQQAVKSVAFADHALDAVQQVRARVILGDVLHQSGNEQESRARFMEAEQLHAQHRLPRPLLTSFQGLRIVDHFSAHAERAAWLVTLRRERRFTDGPPEGDPLDSWLARLRAGQAHSLQSVSDAPLDRALDDLAIGRLRLYQLVLGAAAAPTEVSEILRLVDLAVQLIRQAAAQHHLPRALLTRAWIRAVNSDPAGARADLAEALQTAERAPMPLYLADVHLSAARLFWREDPTAAKAELQAARKLIEKRGYLRRLAELRDAEEVIVN